MSSLHVLPPLASPCVLSAVERRAPYTFVLTIGLWMFFGHGRWYWSQTNLILLNQRWRRGQDISLHSPVGHGETSLICFPCDQYKSGYIENFPWQDV